MSFRLGMSSEGLLGACLWACVRGRDVFGRFLGGISLNKSVGGGCLWNYLHLRFVIAGIFGACLGRCKVSVGVSLVDCLWLTSLRGVF